MGRPAPISPTGLEGLLACGSRKQECYLVCFTIFGKSPDGHKANHSFTMAARHNCTPQNSRVQSPNSKGKSRPSPQECDGSEVLWQLTKGGDDATKRIRHLPGKGNRLQQRVTMRHSLMRSIDRLPRTQVRIFIARVRAAHANIALLFAWGCELAHDFHSFSQAQSIPVTTNQQPRPIMTECQQRYFHVLVLLSVITLGSVFRLPQSSIISLTSYRFRA